MPRPGLDPEQLRRDVVRANHIAHGAGLVTAFGHVSARVGGSDSFVIPSRASPALASLERLLLMDLDGNVLEGEGSPNSEFWIHARIYATRPDVGAVAHVHPPGCVVLSQLGETVRPLHNSAAVLGAVPEKLAHRSLGPIEPANVEARVDIAHV